MRKVNKKLSKKRVVTPTVLQYEAVECGAASLKIVMEYFGKVLALSEIRTRCGVSRDGVTLLQLKQAALSYGMEVKAFGRSAEGLMLSGNFPAILFWNFNHFLVIEGFGKNGQAYLSDPAIGRRKVDWEEFRSSFTGVMMELRPGIDFSPGGRNPGLYRFVSRLLAPYRSLLPWIILIAIFIAIPELFIAGAISQFINSFLQQGRQNFGVPTLWIILISLILLISLQNLIKLILRILSFLLLKRISSLVYISLFSLPYSYFLQRMRGDLASRLILPFILVRLGIGGVVTFGVSVGSGLIGILAGAFISWWLTLFTLSLSALNAAISIWSRKARKSDNYKIAMLNGKVEGYSAYMIQCIESIKASGFENDSFIQWSAAFSASLKESQKQALVSSLIGVIGTTSNFITSSGIILIGGLLIIRGELTLGGLIAFQFIASMIESPLTQLSTLNSQMQQLDGAMGRINDTIETDVDPAVRSFQIASDVTYDETKLLGEISISNLSFQFSSNTPVLFSGLNFNLASGKHLAIVGKSGSGKSTLLRLIAGLHKPTQGEIFYDHESWMDIEDSVLRSSISLVSQDIFVFAETLQYNLTLWDPRFDSIDMINALKESCLFDELNGSNSLNLDILEGGSNLSGGQRQRIEIARAIMRDPKILLLDEATSSLDEKLEKKILSNLKQKDITMITVAHRMYSAQISDWVFVLEDGQIIEQGQPRDLETSGGSYQHLLESELSTNTKKV